MALPRTCKGALRGSASRTASELFLQGSALHLQGNFLKKVSLTFKNFRKWVL